MNVEGSCHCGQITFEAQVDPADVSICHCTDCQTLSGSAYRVSALVPVSQFVLRSGSPKVYIKTAESGKKRAQAFCPDCGTSLYASDVQEPRIYAIRVGTLKQRAQLPPLRQIWYRSALPWVAGIGEIPQREGQ